MPNPELTESEKELGREQFRRYFYAGLQAVQQAGKQTMQDYRTKVAESLLSCGITLIPSQHLRDHEFMVSEEVYKAAKKLVQ